MHAKTSGNQPSSNIRVPKCEKGCVMKFGSLVIIFRVWRWSNFCSFLSCHLCPSLWKKGDEQFPVLEIRKISKSRLLQAGFFSGFTRSSKTITQKRKKSVDFACLSIHNCSNVQVRMKVWTRWSSCSLVLWRIIFMLQIGKKEVRLQNHILPWN